MAGSSRISRVRIFVGLGVALVILAMIKSQGGPPDLVEVSRTPDRVMGGPCLLRAVVPSSELAEAEKALEATEVELRRVDALMSASLPGSDVSRLNLAQAGDTVDVSIETMVLLRASKLGFEATGGAFDVTCRPLVALWEDAGRSGLLPSEEGLSQARASSSWDQFQLLQTSVVKSVTTACVDLDGIAKGLAVDNAIEVMQLRGCVGGLVDLSGDIRAFGPGPSGAEWQVALQNPFSNDVWGRLPALDAVCTSSGIVRALEIQGRQYSHIIDPRTGRPADLVSSATVTGMSAVTADIWATALRVLGTAGFASLPEVAGLEAMVVTGSSKDYGVKMTAGFREMLRGKVVFEAEVQ